MRTFDNATRTSTRDLRREVESLSGQKLAVEAGRMVEAVNRVGGVSKLTAAEMARVNGVLTETVAKYKALGMDVPPEMQKLADATKAAATTVTLSLGQIGQGLKTAGTMATAALTVPIVGAFVLATKAAVDFESSFAGVRKTVDATEPEFAALSQGLRNMAKEIPVSVNELNKVAEAAGQLGIKKDDIIKFTRAMADLGATTNLTADEAATATAQIQNIFGAAGKDVDRFGATLVALGNAGASTEKDIIEMAKRIAGAGNQVGLTQAQVLSFASSLASIGINAEAGGSSISRVFLKINDAVAGGGKALSEFARVSDMSAGSFKKSFESDAAGATVAFINGLGRLKKEGENVNQTLEGLVGKNILIKDTLMRASGAGQLLNKDLALGSQAWRENTALVEEAAKRYETFASQLQIMRNKLNDVAITFGTAMLPVLKDLVRLAEPALVILTDMAKWFAALPDPVRNAGLAVAAFAAAIGPTLFLLGSLVGTVGQLSAILPGLGIAAMGAAAGVTALKLALIGSGIGLAIIGIGILASEIYKLNHQAESSQGKQLAGLATELKTLTGAATTTTGVISGLNKPLFLTADALNGPKGAAPAAEKTAKELKALAKEAEAADNAQARFNDSLAKGTAELVRMDTWLTKFNAQYSVTGDALVAAAERLNKVNDAWHASTRSMVDYGMTNAKVINDLSVGFKETVLENTPDAPSWLSAWAPMREGFKGVLESLPQTLQNAFTGGGGIMGALKAIGVQIASVLTESISMAIAKALVNRTAGTAAANFLLPNSSGGDGPSSSSIGKYAAYATVIGAAAVGIFKIVQHNRHLNDEVKAANVEIEKLRAGLLETYGPLSRLEQQAQALGLSFVAAWGHQGQGGLKAFSDHIKEFERRLGVANEKFAPLLQSATELGVRLPESLLLSIQALRDLGILTEGNAALLDRLAGAADVDWKKMSELAQKYGIDIASLDKSFQQARLGANAQDLINAFQLLTHGKPENQGAVLVGLSDEIQALIDESRQFGTTIPENMRPWIEELRRAGLLTGDLADIHFGEAVKSEIELITDALRELVATLNLVAAGLGGLPTPPPGGGGPGGGGYIDFDSPVPERAIAFSRSGGSGGPQTIVVQVPLDGRVVTEVVLERMGNRYALRGG